MIEKLNSAVNLIAVALVILSLAFVAVHQPQIASNLVSGALGLLGGKALATNKPEAPKDGQ